MPEKSLTIFFISMPAFGHLNPCIGIGQQLLSRNHRVVFAVTKEFEGKLSKFGFEEVFYTKAGFGGFNFKKGRSEVDCEDKLKNNKSKGDKFKHMMESIHIRDPIEALKSQKGPGKMLNSNPEEDQKMLELIREVKPNVLVIDELVSGSAYPVLCGLPFVKLWSGNPLEFYDDPRLPPKHSGYPTFDPSRDPSSRDLVFLYAEYRALKIEKQKEGLEQKNQYLVAQGVAPLSARVSMWTPSPYANLYQFPAELDYTDIVDLPDRFHRFDTLMLKTEDSFEIPAKLRDLAGKLIYFSLGSHVTSLVPVMQKLLDIFGHAPHRFIASGGAKLQELVLPPNVWAESYVPQTAILPLVDLAIVHGGNNSIAECFFFGKPMIVLPIFADQPDNAQRVHEKEFGVRLHPWHVTEAEMLKTIEDLLAHEQLKKRLEKISKRIQEANSQLEAAKVVEKVGLGIIKKE